MRVVKYFNKSQLAEGEATNETRSRWKKCSSAERKDVVTQRKKHIYIQFLVIQSTYII